MWVGGLADESPSTKQIAIIVFSSLVLLVSSSPLLFSPLPPYSLLYLSSLNKLLFWGLVSAGVIGLLCHRHRDLRTGTISCCIGTIRMRDFVPANVVLKSSALAHS
jgi:hypothetical protein